MIPFFKKLRKRFADDNKPMKYTRYAIGEIILVVIGILIALQVNNWNENRNKQNELNGIYNQIVFDLDNDIAELTENLNAYESIEPVFDKVFSDNRAVELLDDGLSRLLASSPLTNLNKSGILRLKAVSVKDSLSLSLIELYDLMEMIHIIPTENKIDKLEYELASIYRDNYSWYPEWISKRITKDNSSQELQDYFVNSQEYRHYVISSYQQIYNNYLPKLRTVIPQLKMIKQELQNSISK